jgi:hypothetical protein
MDRKSTNPTNPTEGRAAGHTPGPWRAFAAVQNNGPNYWLVSDRAFKGNEIARVAREGDAHLIAAAPMLLEAARAALLACESELEWRGECDQDYEPDYQMTPLVTVLRAAIAAAEGQS